MSYVASDQRYSTMPYRRAGRSGLKLPALSLGLWHNFGGVDSYENGRAMLRSAFDQGITHFDLANNYGPPAGSAEEMFGRILQTDFAPYRDELIISSKAGYYMWPGPYGEWGSKKNLIASLDQSLQRMKLDYVDIFYSHRPDPDTPLEETMGVLHQIVRQGKALYVGISSYSPAQTKEASRILADLGTPLLIHQPNYSMLNRGIEDELLDVLNESGVGSIAFCPLAQGLLTNKYLDGSVPLDSRAGGASHFLSEEQINQDLVKRLNRLNKIAHERGQTLAQMSLAWVLREGHVTSALIGASRVSQIEENVQALQNLSFSADELKEIDLILQ
ncbi:L-glyceraldehyde 3-phosphate reductase [Alkalicoccobacillus gibsonii]|uniref:L-glyceraldehyde 3-phosphate reductase n=1 Tax=Alkalicoccobacillus gibsonii TaxID=79881 RepID=UPI001932AEC8|nr:L-glyceraldehyde 3-phosphate reductase [Alkalicoccobacillus gibsonii]MBM0064888.1 L-glyceraldehyde 3-phosphate reductase [Alkalicoccobacillus gibsonii]